MYPNRKKIDDADKYDDDIKQTLPERTIEEEAEDVRDTLLREGWGWNDADYARHKWENDK